MRQKSILLVDDEPGFHDLFRYLMEPLGIKVDSAYNGLEGLERISRIDYPLIFLDVHMPKMSGIEMLKNIREGKPHQKVVLLSSNSDTAHSRASEEKANAVGIEACLEKPFNTDRVLAIVESIMGAPAK